MVVDAGQTADIRNRDDVREDMWPTYHLIGRNPSRTQTATFFAGAIALNYGIAALLPPKYRRLYQFGRISLSAGLIANNWSIGLRWGF